MPEAERPWKAKSVLRKPVLQVFVVNAYFREPLLVPEDAIKPSLAA
jgi:hypothetical protein